MLLRKRVFIQVCRVEAVALVLSDDRGIWESGVDPGALGRYGPAERYGTASVQRGCCAFAGDRGMLHPELPTSAMRAVAADLDGLHASAHFSLNGTSEVGMSRAIGQPCWHVLQVLDEMIHRPSLETMHR